MHVEFAPRGILQIDDVEGRELIPSFRNFKGEGSRFNREGDRNFALRIPDRELADRLIADGWNVKVKPPREEGDDEFIFLPVKVKFNDRGPSVYLVSGMVQTPLDEESIACLDDIDILSANLDIRPYDWEVNGKTGRTAYLQGIKVFQKVDRFAAEYAEYQKHGQ